jgi:hypothetical protein
MLMPPTGSGPGTGWVASGGGALRNATNGNPAARASYYRFASAQDYAPPYVWSGKIRTISMMTPPVFPDGTPAWYKPALVFHPMYGSSTTPAAGNDENVLIGLGTYDRPGHVGISAELRAERPDAPYGARSGYVSRVRGVAPSPFFDGQWHDFEVTVHSHAHYTLTWDGVVMADVVEKTPATMAGRNHVGLRCDFLDIEIKDFAVTTDEGHLMGNRYLTDLADTCRAAGLTVIEVPGWQTRARGSGGYTAGLPSHVMWHHTASNTSATNDVNYMAHGSAIAPIANLYIARNGDVHVIAAGASNTNGSGADTWGGGVADDSMNTAAIGVEMGNAGTGEPYPMAQQDAAVKLGKALGKRYSIPVNNQRAHFEWSPGRKIDPSGPCRWNDNAATFWNMGRFRIDLLPTPPPKPTPPPTAEDTDMLALVSLTRPKGYANVFAVTPWGSRHLGGDSYRRLAAQMAKAGVDTAVHVTDHKQEIAGILAQAGLTHADLVAA